MCKNQNRRPQAHDWHLEAPSLCSFDSFDFGVKLFRTFSCAWRRGVRIWLSKIKASLRNHWIASFCRAEIMQARRLGRRRWQRIYGETPVCSERQRRWRSPNRQCMGALCTTLRGFIAMEVTYLSCSLHSVQRSKFSCSNWQVTWTSKLHHIAVCYRKCRVWLHARRRTSW